MGAMASTCATNGANAGAMIIRVDMVRAVLVGDLAVLIRADLEVLVDLASVPVADLAADPVVLADQIGRAHV